jgi:Putative Flp pilus-assembly TadE/G-like
MLVIRLAHVLRGASDERGAVLVMVVLWLPVLLVFFMFVADVGNWFVHRRHLQMQADAGALAGGGVFRIPCTDTPVLSETRNYSGDPSVGPVYNAQIPPTDSANIHVLINSTSYWNEGGTDFSDGGSPCVTKFVDVKATEANLPWFMRLAFVPAIQAHARVSLLQKSSATGSLPIAVPDVRPRAAAAFIINESTQAILSRSSLTNEGAATMNGASLTKWDATMPSFNNTSVSNVGVVFALSGTTSWSTSGSLATVCAQPLVVCYYNNGSNGLVYMHGYSPTATGTATAPVVRNLGLFAAGGAPCGDTSAPSFVLNGGCTVGVRAQIDWGTGATPPAAADVRVANLGCPSSGNPKGCTMTFNATGPNAGYWVTTQFPTIASLAGPQSIDFNWATGTGGGKISGTITGASRVFSANPAVTSSGPIQFAQAIVDGVIGPSSVAFGTSHSASVAIGVAGNLENDSSFNDPTQLLRVADPSGSQNFAIDCDPSPRTFHDEIATGCQTAYQLNTGQACPNSVIPLNCAAIETGDKVGQLRQGMNDRFASCPVNNWTNPGDPTQFPDIQPGDPRAISIILVPFGSFKASGSGYVPIVDFGTFYVTGWDYVGQKPCPDNEAFPGPGTDSKGDLWGHFIKYVDSINTGGTGGVCDFGSFGTCVAVLTQ